MEQSAEDDLQQGQTQEDYRDWWLREHGDDPRTYEASLDSSVHHTMNTPLPKT